MNEENVEIDEFDDDDYIAQGYGPDDYMDTMGLRDDDDDDGPYNDDYHFMGHE